MTPTSRGFVVGWGAVLLGVGTALCFVPLFDLLGFEFAFAISLPVAVLSGAAAARTVGRARQSWSDSRRRGRVVIERLWLQAVWVALPLAILPLAPITLNALRVRNCDYLEGLSLYAALPGITLVVGTGWGVLASLCLRRGGFLLYLGGIVATVLVGVGRVWFQPPVDVFNPFFGYFPGPLYDEVIHLGPRLLWSRAADVAMVAGVVAVARLLYSPAAMRLKIIAGRSEERLHRTWGNVAVGLAAVAAGGWGVTQLESLDLYRNAEHIQKALGGATRSEHFAVFHPQAWDSKRMQPLMTDLEFRHVQLEAFFGRAPKAPIFIYYYPDAATKKRLMGAGRTRVAKPWQRAVHIQKPAVGDAVVAHELAHVFSAEIAPWPHHLSLTDYGLPNMGLIEGVAVAATWDSGQLDPHQWAAAMRALEIAPPVDRLLRPQGFLTTHSRTAYTLCGSFVRFFRDRRGAEAMAALYASGGSDTGGDWSLADELEAWAAFIDAEHAQQRVLAMARARFDRPAIFGKTCAHEVAALRAEMDAASASGDLAQALDLADTILGHTPRDRAMKLHRAELLLRVSRTEEARAELRQLVDDEGVGTHIRERARERLADFHALAHDHDQARQGYDDLLATSFRRSDARRLAVKRAAVSHGEAGEAVLRLLSPSLAGPDESVSPIDQIEQIWRQAPAWSVARYLYGRQAIFASQTDAGIAQLRAALEAEMPHPALVIEAHRLIAATWFDTGRFADASAAFHALAARDDLGLERGERSRFETWSQRSAFFEASALRSDGQPR